MDGYTLFNLASHVDELQRWIHDAMRSGEQTPQINSYDEKQIVNLLDHMTELVATSYTTSGGDAA